MEFILIWTLWIIITEFVFWKPTLDSHIVFFESQLLTLKLFFESQHLTLIFNVKMPMLIYMEKKYCLILF